MRWLSVMLLAPIPWARRVWALPVLTALAPSERYARERGVRHKRLTDWAHQLLRQVRRWLPGRALIMVADSTFAALDLLAALAPCLTCITRFRLDAQLFAPPPPRRRHTLRSWLPALPARAPCRPHGRHGIRNARRRSATRWPPFAASCGATKDSRAPRASCRSQNPRGTCSHASRIYYVMRPNGPKSS